MKRKMLISSLALGAVALGVGSSVALMATDAIDQAKAADTVQVGDLATFKSVFDGGAGSVAKNIELTADIDYGGGDAVGLRMAGSFSGTFNGNGHTISNITLNQAFFNLVTGTIENLTFNCTSTGSGFGGLAYAIDTGGKVSNVTINATFGAALNNWGPVAFWSKGTISDCKAYITIPTAYAAANTLFHMARNDSGSTFTNDLYKVTGTGSFLADPTGVSEMVTVSAATVANVSVAATATATATATLTGNDYNHIKWVVGDTSIATVSSASTTTNTVTVNGVVAGSTTLTATVYGDAAEATKLAEATATITVTAGSAVSGVALSKTTTTLKAGLTEAITATLTGDLYDHVTWASDATSYATVSGSGLSATIAAVAVGTTNISVTVFNSSNTVLATASCAVTVQAPDGFNLYLLEQLNWSVAYAFLYNGGPDTAMAMTKVQSNSKDVSFRIADTTDGGTVKNYNVWKLFVNTTAYPAITSSSFAQFYNMTAGRWGSGVQLGTITDGVIMVLPVTAPQTGYKSSWTEANLNSALTYAATTIYGSDWRDTSGSICSKTTDTATIKSLYDTYNALGTDVKAIVDSLNDSTTAYNATYGETMAMLHKYYPSGSGTNTIQSTEDKDNAALIAAIAAMGVIALGAGAFIIARKKQH
jgi:hypothetical protein